MCAMKIFVDPICSRVADPNFKAIPLLIIYNFHPRADSCQQIHSAARPQVRLPSTCPNLGRSVLSVSENRAQSPARLLIFHHLPHYWPFLGRSSSVSNLPTGVVELPLLSDNYPTKEIWREHPTSQLLEEENHRWITSGVEFSKRSSEQHLHIYLTLVLSSYNQHV